MLRQVDRPKAARCVAAKAIAALSLLGAACDGFCVVRVFVKPSAVHVEKIV